MNTSKNYFNAYVRANPPLTKAMFVQEQKQYFKVFREWFLAKSRNQQGSNLPFKLFQKWMNDLGYVSASKKVVRRDKKEILINV